MPLTIAIQNQQKQILLDPSRLTVITRQILRSLKIKQADLSIALVTDAKIKALNRKFLGRAYATDVLAFDFSDKKTRLRTVKGEVVISADTARRNAQRFKTSPGREVVLYIAHGILHLLGFDDHSPRDTARMRRAEQRIMNHLADRHDP